MSNVYILLKPGPSIAANPLQFGDFNCTDGWLVGHCMSENRFWKPNLYFQLYCWGWIPGRVFFGKKHSAKALSNMTGEIRQEVGDVINHFNGGRRGGKE